MIWKVTDDKEYNYNKCFALFPVAIDEYRVWLSFYYKTWDYTNDTYGYVPRRFVYEEDVIRYIEEKKRGCN